MRHWCLWCRCWPLHSSWRRTRYIHRHCIPPGLARQGAVHLSRLTINPFVQSSIVEPELQAVLKQFHATSATIVVERPSDGAIIALASAPNHDTRTWEQILASHTAPAIPDPAIGVAAAPGQVIEPLIAGIGFDTGRFTRRTTVSDSGHYPMTDGISIENWCADSCAFSGPLTVANMLHYGSNIAAVKFVQRIPTQQFYQYLERLGFGHRTGAGLPGEVSGMIIEPYRIVLGREMRNPTWIPAYQDIAGYGDDSMLVTPLQMATAYAIARQWRVLRATVSSSVLCGGDPEPFAGTD